MANKIITIENTAELVDFLNKNISELLEKYKHFSKNAKSTMQKKSCAFFASQEVLFEKGVYATECQINKLSELLIVKIGE